MPYATISNLMLANKDSRALSESQPHSSFGTAAIQQAPSPLPQASAARSSAVLAKGLLCFSAVSADARGVKAPLLVAAGVLADQTPAGWLWPRSSSALSPLHRPRKLKPPEKSRVWQRCSHLLAGQPSSDIWSLRLPSELRDVRATAFPAGMNRRI